MAYPDTTKPDLTRLDLPVEIDVRNGAQSAAFLAFATDPGGSDASGVYRVTVTLDRPIVLADANGRTAQATRTLTFGSDNDSFADGSAAFTGSFSASSGAGDYHVTSVSVSDYAGNTTTYSEADVLALGGRSSFTIRSNQAADLTPPELTGLSLSTTSVDVRTNAGSIGFTVNANDSGSGLQEVRLELSNGVFNASNTQATTLIYYSGFRNGQATVNQSIGNLTGAGEYYITSASLVDQAGNRRVYSRAELNDAGFTTSFIVDSNQPMDTSGPVLSELIPPATNSLDVTDSPKTADFFASFNDASGVSSISLKFDRNVVTSTGVSVNTVSINNTTGMGSLTIDDRTGAGTYNIISATLIDKLGNVRFYDASQLSKISNVSRQFTVIDRKAPLAEILPVAAVREGNDTGIELSINVNNVINRQGTIKLTLARGSEAGTSDVRVPTVVADYTIEPGTSNALVRLTSAQVIQLIDDQVPESLETLSIQLQMTGQLFANGTDTTIVPIQIIDNDQIGGDGADFLIGTQFNDYLNGGAGDDVLIGGVGIDTLIGSDGADILDGGPDADTMQGGAGNDTYYVDNTSDKIVEDTDAGTDIVFSTDGFSLPNNVENLTLLGSNDLRGTGNAMDNVIIGNDGANSLSGGAGNDVIEGRAGNDILNGGAGADRLIGGLGNDLFIIDNVSDRVIENENEGFDTILSGVSYTLSRNVERLVLSGASNLRGTGTGNADQLFGNAGNNVLSGLAGDDLLVGGLGSDTMTGGAGNDTFLGTRVELNGDRITDLRAGDRIVVSDAALGSFGYLLSGGTLRFTTGETMTLDDFAGKFAATAAPEGGVALTVTPGSRLSNDFNGDGRSDIFWRDTNGAFSTWLGRADGGFNNNDTAAYQKSVGVAWRVAGSGDFNGDGRSDILFRNEDGRITNWLGNTNGGIVNNDAIALSTIEASWRVVAVDDFNGDGRADILFRNQDGRISNWLGRADGGFVNNDTAALGFVSNDWRVAGSGDFNGDGYADILFRNQDGRITNWLGRADGGFINNDAVGLGFVDKSWEVVGTGDINGDGNTDLVWRNVNGNLSTWLGSSNGAFVNNDAAAYVTGTPTSWHIVDTGDYDGDGRFDILWRDDNGSLTTSLGNTNGAFTNTPLPPSFAPTNWQVQNDYMLV